MVCPACGKSLSEVKAGSITVHVCREGCGGIWVNHFQLDKIDMPDEYDGQILADLQNKGTVRVDINAPLKCPACADKIPMIRHFFSVKKDAVMDECPECGGYWIGMGQLLKIRGDFKTEAEREKAADDYFQTVFGKEMAQMMAQDKIQEEKALKFHHLFEYICPSHYFKDKTWNEPYR